MEECPNTKSITVFGKNHEQRKAILFNPRCKQWSCDFCAELNKDYWIHQATRGTLLLLQEGQQIQFMTLTSQGYTTPNSSVYFFKQNWPKMRKRLQRITEEWKPFTGINWGYFLIPERQESGRLHCHILAVTHVTGQKWLRDNAVKSGFGYMADISENVNSLQAAYYTAKYLHKGVGAEEWPKGFRRVRHSQNWPISKPQPIAGWEWSTYKRPETIWIEKNALLNMGWEVIDKTE